MLLACNYSHSMLSIIDSSLVEATKTAHSDENVEAKNGWLERIINGTSTT